MNYANTSRRLPIVFCLDVSPSMGFKSRGHSSSIKLLNQAVNDFIDDLKNDKQLAASVEICFITFSTGVEHNSGFKNVSEIKKSLKFRAVSRGGSRLSIAVNESVEVLEKRKKELSDNGIPFYAPFLVIITDGNPDHADDAREMSKTINLVKSHCSTTHIDAITNLIIPFVVGVGDIIDSETLKLLSAGFVDGYFTVRGESDKTTKGAFSSMFKVIRNSAKTSQSLNPVDAISTIQKDLDDALKNDPSKGSLTDYDNI